MTDIELLDEIIESLLFVSGDGIGVSEIVNLLELQNSEVNRSIARLKKKYGGKCGIHLISYNGKVQFASNPAYADVIASVLNPVKEKELSNAALETIAIIAYKQPTTRLEIEQIRGVNCDYAIQVLLKHNLIEVVGRKDVVGKPLLFGTTDTFLKRFQIENINQLPDYEQLLESIKVLESGGAQQASTGLYNEFELPPEETEEGETPAENGEEDLVLPEEEETPDFLANETDLQRVE
ncbi:MAG: SMC-Scp complex subunit ScpB [Clostridiales bacterium]|nr:SMC-Scp complex subunit ScpB [Clostridiales bacterium]